MFTVKSFLRNFKVVHPRRLIFLKKLFYLKISYESNLSSILSVSNIFSEIYIHYARKLINTRRRSAALYLHQILFNHLGVD